MKPPCAEDIVKEWLREHGCDALIRADGDCSCSIDDLGPCLDGIDPCYPARKVPCEVEDCDICSFGWHAVELDVENETWSLTNWAARQPEGPDGAPA